MNSENTTIYNQINLNCWMVAAQIQLNKKVAIYLKPGVGFPQMSLKQGSLWYIAITDLHNTRLPPLYRYRSHYSSICI